LNVGDTTLIPQTIYRTLWVNRPKHYYGRLWKAG
jgi:hypothetical protein